MLEGELEKSKGIASKLQEDLSHSKLDVTNLEAEVSHVRMARYLYYLDAQEYRCFETRASRATCGEG